MDALKAFVVILFFGILVYVVLSASKVRKSIEIPPSPSEITVEDLPEDINVSSNEVPDISFDDVSLPEEI